MKAEGKRRAILAVLAVLATAGIANADLLAYYDFGTANPSTANLGTAGSAADGVLMNGATIVDVDPDPRGAEYVLNLDYGDGTVHQYMNIGGGGGGWNNWNGAGIALQTMTIAAWIYVTPGTTGSWRTIISAGFESSWSLNTGTPFTPEDQVAWSAHHAVASWSPLQGTTSVRDGWWHHVVGTVGVIEGGPACLYIDGVLQDSEAIWCSVYAKNEDVWIGYDPLKTDWDFSWNGMIDEVRIYNEALDEQAVQDLYYDYVDRYPYPPVPVSLEITGPEEVPESSQAQYTATACIDYQGNPDCCDVDVTENATWWVEPETFASIDANGLLTVESLDASQSITIHAQYTLSNVTVEGEMTVVLYGIDINGDGVINLVDFSILAGQWLGVPGVPSADIAPPPGGDGVVDINDLAVLVDFWLECYIFTASGPSPGD